MEKRHGAVGKEHMVQCGPNKGSKTDVVTCQGQSPCARPGPHLKGRGQTECPAEAGPAGEVQTSAGWREEGFWILGQPIYSGMKLPWALHSLWIPDPKSLCVVIISHPDAQPLSCEPLKTGLDLIYLWVPPIQHRPEGAENRNQTAIGPAVA